MLLRFLAPGISILMLMLFVCFLPKYQLQTQSFNLISLDSFLYLISFATLTHVWITGLKKQRKHANLRSRAIQLVGLSFFLLIFAIELIQWQFVAGRLFQWYDIFAGVFGVFIGIVFFRLVYSRCY